MNQVELNAILFYADFLSLKEISQPITDNCKYFYIYGLPVNSAFIVNVEPEYDKENQYFKQAKTEYEIIKDKFGEGGIQTFIDDICCIKSCGTVNAEDMLKCIHRFSNKKERNQAFNIYNTWKNNKKYTHITINENGDPKETPCSKYVYHAEKMLGRLGLAESI